jgi:hypothetical protein
VLLRDGGCGFCISTMSDDADNIDEEWIWESICDMAAGRAGISVERAREILEAAGYHAYRDMGIVEATEVVVAAVGGIGLGVSPELRRCTTS